MGPKAAPRSNRSTTVGAPKPVAAGGIKPSAVGTVKSATAGTVKPPAFSAVKPQRTVHSSHAPGSLSNRVPSSSTTPGKPICDTRPRQAERKDGGVITGGTNETSLVKIVVFISHAHDPAHDYHFNRHVKAHFTSPQAPNLHETVHAAYTRLRNEEQWEVVRDHDKKEQDLRMSQFFHSKMDPVWVTVNRGQEMVPANIFASVDVTNREGDWNCQAFLLEGFKKLAERGYKTMQWYNNFEDELLDEIMSGALM